MALITIVSACLVTVLTTGLLKAASGTMTFRVTDVISHRPVQAVITGQGPESFTLTTDANGRASRQLQEGDYLLEFSALGYSPLKTRFIVSAGKTVKAGALLTPTTPPPEENRELLNSELRSGYTLLHGYVIDHATGDPIVGVTVSLGGVQTQTDSQGHYSLSVPTPKPKYPGGVGTGILVLRKPGYKTTVFHNFGVVEEEMGPTTNEMDKGQGAVDIDATHKLMKEEPGQAVTSEPLASALSPEASKWVGSTGEGMSVTTIGTTTPASCRSRSPVALK